MSVSVVVGGQFGSEGKGKVSLLFARKLKASAVVRVGGTNSGHTVIADNGTEHIFRTLPTAAVDPTILSILPSGSYINVEILFNEIESVGLRAENLKIDPYAVIIDGHMAQEEERTGLCYTIGSTLSGTGVAVSMRATRSGDIVFAKDVEQLRPFVCETKKLMRRLLDAGQRIIIEGTQGFGLSPLNSTYYPYCTSRDTTAASFVSEAGLSPLDVENIIMVIRAYPIRVGGNSGPLPKETDWARIAESACAGCDLTEYTSATKRIRRVAEFDADIVKEAIRVNHPNIIVMNHLDYIDYRCHNKDLLSGAVCSFISNAENEIGKNIDYIGNGQALLTKNRRNTGGFYASSI
jgi:adenylosuccinate synthase